MADDIATPEPAAEPALSPPPEPRPDAQPPLLRIENVVKTFGNFRAVDGVSLDIRAGEFFALLGPSGCGKTTLLRMLAGFETPDDGRILLSGEDIAQVLPHQRPVNMMFQNYALFPHLNVRDNIAFGLRRAGMPRAEIATRVAEMVALVRLEGLEKRKPDQLSGGQKQRVALARSLARRPQVLLLDEPMAALDKKLREEIQFEIRRIHQETGVTILYVTHDQEEALRLSDRIAVFSQGEIDQIGTGPELYANPATRFVAGFIGDSNFIDADVVGIQGDKASLALPGGTRIDGVPLHGRSVGAGRVSLLLRPERIDLEAGTRPGRLGGVVRDITFLGNNFHILVEPEGVSPISVRLPFGHAAIPAIAGGQAVSLGFNPDSAHAFAI